MLAYPSAYILRWGVVYYLRARQQTEAVAGPLLHLTDDERTELLARQKERIELLARQKDRKQGPLPK